MVKRTFVCLFLIYYVNCILAQEQEINIQIEIVTVTYDAAGVSSLTENTIPDPVYKPVAITFHCSVANKSKKEYFLFESNPVAFFRDEDFIKAYKHDTMGYFYLINEKDSVLLFNYRSGSAFKKEEFGVSPGVDVFLEIQVLSLSCQNSLRPTKKKAKAGFMLI